MVPPISLSLVKETSRSSSSVWARHLTSGSSSTTALRNAGSAALPILKRASLAASRFLKSSSPSCRTRSAMACSLGFGDGASAREIVTTTARQTHEIIGAAKGDFTAGLREHVLEPVYTT